MPATDSRPPLRPTPAEILDRGPRRSGNRAAKNYRVPVSATFFAGAGFFFTYLSYQARYLS